MEFLEGSPGLHILEIWFPARDNPKTRNQKPTCTVTGLIINLICWASIWTQNSREWWRVPKLQNPTTSFGQTESLWQMNDRRIVILTTILNALTHGPSLLQMLQWPHFVFRRIIWAMFALHHQGGISWIWGTCRPWLPLTLKIIFDGWICESGLLGANETTN